MDSIYVDNMTDDKYVYSIYSVIVADWDTIYMLLSLFQILYVEDDMYVGSCRS